jgi:HemY protein
MKFLRLFFLILVVLLIVGGFGYLATLDGEISFKSSSTNISTNPAVAAGALLFVTLVMAMLWGLLGWLWALPSKLKQSQAETGRKKALEAYGLSVAAHDSGDFSESRRWAQKALSALPSQPAIKFLAARAALAADDIMAAEKQYSELVETTNYQVVARKGLADIARLKGNFAAVISHADAALQITKTSTWPTEVIFKERINSGDWEGALVAVDEADKRGFVSKKTAARRRSVVLTAAAHRAEKNNNLEKALEYSARAVKQAPNFAPAVVMAARLNAKASKEWAAASTIENAWATDPHPALALAYKDLKTGQSKAAISKWTQGLVKLNPEHRESKILVVEDHIANNNAIGAIAVVEHLIQVRPTSRLLALRAGAALIQADKKGFDDWMQKAAVAPREPDWSDLDPEGSAFAYEDEDWARMVEAFGDSGKLIHPRLERLQSSRLIMADANSTSGASLITAPKPNQETLNPPSADDPGVEY